MLKKYYHDDIVSIVVFTITVMNLYQISHILLVLIFLSHVYLISTFLLFDKNQGVRTGKFRYTMQGGADCHVNLGLITSDRDEIHPTDD